MLKLMKYEYKKNKILLLGLLFLIMGLELYFLIGYASNDMQSIGNAIIFLVLATVVGFFFVLFLGIHNYDRELKSKSSYLIFMTPNSSLKIIVSKMLYVLVIGIVIVAIFGSIAIFDIQLFATKVNEKFFIIDILKEIAKEFRVDLSSVWMVIIIEILYFVINFFSTVALAYLAITLASTLLQNKKFKGFISVVLFVLLSLGVTKLNNMFFEPDVKYVESVVELLVNLLPTILYNGVVIVASVFGCSFLLDRAVSL